MQRAWRAGGYYLHRDKPGLSPFASGRAMSFEHANVFHCSKYPPQLSLDHNIKPKKFNLRVRQNHCELAVNLPSTHFFENKKNRSICIGIQFSCLH
jgi:hypothetical protein